MALWVHEPGQPGVWKGLTEAWAGAGGAWKKITKIWVGVGGVWKQCYANSGVVNPIPVFDIGDIEVGANALGTLNINSTGTITTTGNDCNTGGNWYLPTTAGIGNTHWVTLDKLSGDDPTSGDSVGFIHALSSNRSWSWAQNVLGNRSGVYQLRIWGDAGATVLLGTANFNVNVERT
jgi:hypothetical protein